MTEPLNILQRTEKTKLSTVDRRDYAAAVERKLALLEPGQKAFFRSENTSDSGRIFGIVNRYKAMHFGWDYATRNEGDENGNFGISIYCINVGSREARAVQPVALPPHVDKNVPLPDDTIPPRRFSRSYALSTWAVRDSQFYEAPTAEARRGIRVYVSAYKRAHPGWDYVSRKVVENGVEGIRLWCVALPSAPAYVDIIAFYDAATADKYNQDAGWQRRDAFKADGGIEQAKAALATAVAERPDLRHQLYVDGQLTEDTHPPPLTPSTPEGTKP